MFKIAPWYNNHQAPAVLMIDDLSDAYIDVYPESSKNDWGYLGEQEGSAYHFLEQALLQHYPKIKITFFVPYARHGIIHEHCTYPIKKYGLGDRENYTNFLKILTSKGHEIAHHGSDHGKYVDPTQCDVGENWKHEWALFKTVDEGVGITRRGVELFKQTADIDIVGGKYCGYIAIDNSQEIIDQCNFLYWCEKGNYQSDDTSFFGKNQIFSFPTSFAGNSFVRLTYQTGDPQRDRKKRYMKFLQPLYTLLSYYKLYRLYKHRKIISIQEHISPSTTWGTVQSSNIITDRISLKKIFSFLQPFNIWYATCAEIAAYLTLKSNTTLEWDTTSLTLRVNNTKNLTNTYLSLTHEDPFVLKQNTTLYHSQKNNGLHTVSIPVTTGDNSFEYTHSFEYTLGSH
jgi:hypothetical protein